MRASIHYANLTNGLQCPHLVGEYGFTRIQSTHCEQKLWGAVLLGVGPDILMHLALGVPVVVHDVSERERETRAMWQGLRWVRYACQRAWGVEPDAVLSRNGMDVTKYFCDALHDLSDPERAYISYYSRWYAGRGVNLASCWESKK